MQDEGCVIVKAPGGHFDRRRRDKAATMNNSDAYSDYNVHWGRSVQNGYCAYAVRSLLATQKARYLSSRYTSTIRQYNKSTQHRVHGTSVLERTDR